MYKRQHHWRTLTQFQWRRLLAAKGDDPVSYTHLDVYKRQAKQFGHNVLPTRAGLVPLTLSGTHAERLQDLAGVSLPVEATCNGMRFRNFMLITHRGISGPSILQISSYWQPGDDLRLDLLPGIDSAQQLADWQRTRRDTELKTVLSEVCLLYTSRCV